MTIGSNKYKAASWQKREHRTERAKRSRIDRSIILNIKMEAGTEPEIDESTREITESPALIRYFAREARNSIVFLIMRMMQSDDSEIETAVRRFVTQNLRLGNFVRVRPIHAAARFIRGDTFVILIFQDLTSHTMLIRQ